MDVRDTCQPDCAEDRAARAARTLAAVAHDAARKYVQRDAVTPQAKRYNPDVVTRWGVPYAAAIARMDTADVDTAERERQARLRRWHTSAHPNRKGG